MPWSVTIGRIAGSEIRIHLTFLILLAWIGIIHYRAGGVDEAIEGVLFIVSVFACVVLHELGHAVAARRYGIKTPDITLLPIGGLARLERMPENPRQEIVIAIAGPAVNVVIAAILILIIGRIVDPTAIADIENPSANFLVRLASVNIFLVVFNLIPAFPMDGGRVLRAVLALRWPRAKATRIAATVGQALAFFFGFLGLIGGNPILVFIAIFVYLAAGAEAQGTGMTELARRMPVERAMIVNFETLSPNATVDDAADALLRTTQSEFPVVDGGNRLRGALTRDAMIHAIRDTGALTPVLDVMAKDIPTVARTERLDKALELLRQATPMVGVTDASGVLVGYVSTENVAELMMLDAVDWHGSAASPNTPNIGLRR